MNLLSNASKYSAENKRIYISVNATATHLSISVRDEGMGIPVNEQKHLFSQFFRSPSVANIPGTGLGLSIVKQYVDLLNGKISFESVENIGTTFSLEFVPGKC